MKTFGLALLFSLSGIYSLAQISDDTTRIKVGGTTVVIINGEIDTNYVEHNEDGEDDDFNPGIGGNDHATWSGLYFGVNGFLTSDNSTSLPSESNFLDLDYGECFHFELNILEKRFKLGTPHVGLTTGLGFDFNRYGFKRNLSIDFNSDSIWGVVDSSVTYRKNFLKATYIQIPLLLDFTTHKDPDKAVQLSFGVIGGYRIGGKMKLKYEQDGNKTKDRTRGHYNLNPFKLSATARLTYSGVTLFANYGLTQVFEKNRAPEVYPFSVGLALTPF